ncbi:MAG: hypothetical protein U5J98_01140 [Halobacteriales archaeon]|nr:hypothetical protein [Halobacteriales archaeon]
MDRQRVLEPAVEDDRVAVDPPDGDPRGVDRDALSVDAPSSTSTRSRGSAASTAAWIVA